MERILCDACLNGRRPSDSVETFTVQLPSNLIPVIDRWFELRDQWLAAATESEQEAIRPEIVACVDQLEECLHRISPSYALGGKTSRFIEHRGGGNLVCARNVLSEAA